MSDPTPRATPLSFSPRRLVEFACFYAAEVAQGAYPYVDFDPDERWHQRIYRDPRIDVWLISWLPSQGTELHDHGGSAGAFTVLSGTLTEASLTPRRTLVDRERGPGARVGFPASYVHDVRNLGDEPAVSVHAYSRPLTSMTYYDFADGELTTIRTLATEDPEPDVSLADVRSAS